MTKKMAEKKPATWLVGMAQQHMSEGDPFAAKAWLLTAKTLHPTDFSVQYEEFLMERDAGHIQTCGKLFYEMMSIFSKEAVLWEELSRIFHSQDVTRLQNSENRFLKAMFDSLPIKHQRDLLLKYANHQDDLIDKCRISLLVLKRFKAGIKDQALKLIATLKNVDDREFKYKPLNIYRRMIVCDVLPLILKSADIQVMQLKSKAQGSGNVMVGEELMVSYLSLTMEFFANYALSKTNLFPVDALDHSHFKDMDLEETTSCWGQMHENLVAFATKLGWNNVLKFKDKIDPAKNRPLKSRWKTLSNARETKQPLGLFYAVLQLHLYTVIEYASSVYRSAKKEPSSPTNDDNLFILADNIDHMSEKKSCQSVSRTPKKKKKSEDSQNYSDQFTPTEDTTVVIHPSLLGKVSENIGEYLQVAIDSQNFLKSVFKNEYEAWRTGWNINTWHWMEMFQIDADIYQRRYSAVIEALRDKLSIKEGVQLASVYFSSGQHKLACETALDCVARLPSSAFTENNGEHKSPPCQDGRSLLLLSSSASDVLTYAVQIVFASVKERLHLSEEHNDYVVGHLIVLSQLTWAKNVQLFLQLLKLIQSQDEGFKYPLFFSYVTQIEILEEFSFLHSIDSIPLTLTFAEDVTGRQVTRGVNKEAQSDFKSSVLRQVRRSNEPIKSVVFNFMRNERAAILDVL